MVPVIALQEVRVLKFLARTKLSPPQLVGAAFVTLGVGISGVGVAVSYAVGTPAAVAVVVALATSFYLLIRPQCFGVLGLGSPPPIPGATSRGNVWVSFDGEGNFVS